MKRQLVLLLMFLFLPSSVFAWYEELSGDTTYAEAFDGTGNRYAGVCFYLAADKLDVGRVYFYLTKIGLGNHLGLYALAYKHDSSGCGGSGTFLGETSVRSYDSLSDGWNGFDFTDPIDFGSGFWYRVMLSPDQFLYMLSYDYEFHFGSDVIANYKYCNGYNACRSDFDPAFAWSSADSAPKVTVTEADLVSNTVSVQLSGPSSSSGILTVTANGNSNNYPAIAPTGPVGPGTYQVTFDRPNMPADTYISITAQWNVSPTPLSTTFALADEWLVLGVIRHSQYNTPAESQCIGSLAPAWVFDSNCQFTKTRLNSQFMRQVYVNGTGRSQSYGILKYSNPNQGGLCSGSYPPGANPHNTFLEVSSVSGACLVPLVGDISVATYPSPRIPNTTFTCGDAILLTTAANDNEAIKDVEDYCPACARGFNGTQGHIDDYSSIEACTASGVGDLGNFWTANTHKETQ